MKKDFCILFLASCFAAQAQNKFVDLAVNSDKLQIYSYANEDKLVYFLRERNILHLLAYDTAYSLVKQAKYNLQEFIDKSEGVLAVSEMNGMPSLFFADKKLATFSSVSLDLRTFDLKQYTFPKLAADVYYLACFSARQRFYVLCYSDKAKPTLILKEYPGDGTVADHAISLADLPINKGIWDEWYQLFFEYGNSAPSPFGAVNNSLVKRIRWDEPADNFTIASVVKLYTDDNRCIISLNCAADTTQLINIDLASFNTTLKKISAGASACKKRSRRNENSFLLDNKLFSVVVCRENLLFRIFNAETGAMLKEFAAGSNEEMTFKNGPFHKVIRGREKEKEPDTQDMFGKLSDNSGDVKMDVAVNSENDKEYVVTIGSSKSAAGSYPFMMPFNPVPMFTPSMSGFRVLLPALLWQQGYSSLNTPDENYFFRMHLKKDDLSFISKPDAQTRLEKLQSEVKRLNDTEGIKAVGAIRFRGQTVISFFNTMSQRFFLKAEEL